MHSVASLAATPNSLADHYRRFRVRDRLLLTGHSHQAWPDCAEAGQAAAWDDAAMFVDDKWERAFERADRMRAGWARLLSDDTGHIALSASTHDALVRLLSSFPLRERPRIVTTDGEFHSMRRQLERLEEEGIEVDRVSVDPADEVAPRILRSLKERAQGTAAVMVSSVLFASARIVPGLGDVAQACERHGVPLIVDAYHHLNVVPMNLREAGLEQAFVVGGGYKYCQLGEGNAFLRFPRDCALRPVVTGWFSEFSLLASDQGAGQVGYGQGPDRFAGATYDPTSHYRGAEVFAFFEREGLSPALLREVSQHQVGRLCDGFDELDLDPAVIDRDRAAPVEALGGFLALRSSRAGEIREALRARGVMTDSRGEVLRFGPAPYLADAQLDEAMRILGTVVRAT
jgi:selenocysteine lyase/cysteine desulfurase